MTINGEIMAALIGLLSMYARRTRKVKGFAVVIFIFSMTMESHAQDRCGTVQYTKILQEKNLVRENDRKFEQWLGRKMDNLSSRLSASTATFKIPVVVHVIHNGEAIGSGVNISDAQILSQIKVLNNDFRRLNADTANTPSEFLSRTGRINIEFILAKQSPEGIATTGILRVKGTKRQWTIDDNNALKSESYWPAEDYLNIWVTDIASTILGYAQFPVSDLPGLEDPEDNRLTDGVVLDYRIVGSNEDGSFNLTSSFNRGRTATHEVGHFFGLRHIWGDDDGACSGDGDYVDDTPDQGNSTSGCPSHPQVSCNARTMFQNYMDYTNDVCMNLYTQQQVNRMLSVLENSPRRTSLLTSEGLYDPALVNNDLAIAEVASPSTGECTGIIVPLIVVKNKGLNTITSARIQVTAGDDILETKDISFNALEPQLEAEVSFAPFTLSAGRTDFHFKILQTNFMEDGKQNDNEKEVTTEVPDLIATPFSENFGALPASWSIRNEDAETTWSVIQTGQVNNSSNTAVFMKFFQSEDAAGEIDIITTPVIDLSQATSPFLAFDVAYGRYQNHADGLEVYALLNCVTDLASSEKIYSRYGSLLATVSSTTSSFSPSNENQWRREVIDLSKFIGQSQVQLAFVGISDNGNNLYLDNIAVRTDVSENIAVAKLTHPSPVHCSGEIQPTLLVENKGSVPIHNFKLQYSVNGENTETMFVSEDFNLPAGEQATVTLPLLSLTSGENLMSFEITHPNGFIDVDSTDNIIEVKTVVSSDEDKIPLRKNFDRDEQENTWQIANPTGNTMWETVETNHHQSLYADGSNTTSNDHEYSWFVSPVLDFSEAVTASLFFDLSFRYKDVDSINDRAEEVFKVLASRDCGETFVELLYSKNESSLAETNRKGEGVPSSDDDWIRDYINLNTLAGEENVRVAFVVSDALSSPIYLDNIEFFLSDNPSPFATSELYSLYPNKLENTKSFYLTFNLTNRQPVAYELVDMLGRQVGSKELTEVLNQTYKVDVENASNGIYLVRLLIDKKYYVSRIVVSQ